MADLIPNRKPSSTKRALQVLALLLILVILPIGTLYYTSSGNDYFKEMISELHEYGTIPPFEFVAHNGQTMNEEKTKDKLVVNAFFSLDDPKTKLLGTQIKKLHGQFADKNEVLFLLYTLNPEEDTVEELQQFAQSAGLTDEEQCYLLTGTQQEIHDHLANGFKWPVNFDTRDITTKLEFGPIPDNIKAYPYIVVADKESVIRNYYDFENNNKMSRLVEHLALLLPSRVDNDPELKRELEK